MVDPEPRAAGAAASASLGRLLPSTLETRLRAREAASVGLAVKSKSVKISSEIPLGAFRGEGDGTGGGFAEGLRPGRDPEGASTSISQSRSSSSSVRSPGLSSRAIVGVPRESVYLADLKSDETNDEQRRSRARSSREPRAFCKKSQSRSASSRAHLDRRFVSRTPRFAATDDATSLIYA